MNYFAKTLMGLAALLFLASGASAQVFDIAGVELGMDRHQAEKALEAKGYTPNKVFPNYANEDMSKPITWDRNSQGIHFTPHPNFMQQVLLNKGDKISVAEFKGVEKMRYSKNSSEINEEETIEILFSEYPSGSFARQIMYVFYGDSISREDFKARAIEKYGPADKTSSINNKWSGDQNISRDDIQSKETLMQFSKTLKLKSVTTEYNVLKKRVKSATPVERNTSSTTTTF